MADGLIRVMDVINILGMRSSTQRDIAVPSTSNDCFCFSPSDVFGPFAACLLRPIRSHPQHRGALATGATARPARAFLSLVKRVHHRCSLHVPRRGICCSHQQGHATPARQSTTSRVQNSRTKFSKFQKLWFCWTPKRYDII